MMVKERIAVIGAGLMGHGLAQVFASGGHTVRVFDSHAPALTSLHSRVAANLASLGIEKDLSPLIEGFADLATTVDGADVIIEAAPERLDIKQSIFAELIRLAPPSALIASNTSVIPISNIAAGLPTGERILGTHWWNPPFLVPLVEVVKSSQTSQESVDKMLELLRRVGKTPVFVKKDVPGFVGNRLQHALWREAIAIVAEGIADAETVDTVVKNSFGRRLAVLGPLENADLIGTDLTLDIHNAVLSHIDRTPGPSPYLKALVDQGRLGMKSGVGFKSWSEEEMSELRRRVFEYLRDFKIT